MHEKNLKVKLLIQIILMYCSQINHTTGERMMKKQRYVLQADCRPIDLEMAKKVAEYRGVSVSHMLRQSVRDAFKRLPEEAK